MKDRCICVSMLVFFLFNVPLLTLAQPHADKFSPFYFSVLGDNRPHGDPEKIIQPVIFKKAIQEINLLGSEFTVIVGDLILGYEDDDELIKKEWDEYFGTCKEFRNHFYSVVGNHDVWNKKSEQIWLKRHGPLYYAFSYKGCRFICLYGEDPEKMNYIYGEQLAWLKSELEEHKDAKYIFVFLHKPLWREQYFPKGSTNWEEDVHPVLAKYRVNTVFAGHEHVYELSEELDGVRYIITGGAGAEIGDLPYQGNFFHHLFISVLEKEVQIAVIKTGAIFPQDVVTQSRVQQVDEFLTGASFKSVSVQLGSSVEQLAKVFPENLFDKNITVDFFLQSKESSGWSCKDTHKQVILKPGESAELSFQISFDGKNLFPSLETRMECLLESESILEVKSRLSFELERPLRAIKARDKIEIDGKLDEESWKKTESAGKWMNIDGTEWATEITDWFICYDNEFLYIAFDCKEDEMKNIKQTSKERDWGMLGDDCVIFYLDPVRDGKSRFCFGINAFGVKMDYRAPQGKVDFTWNPEWDIKVAKGKEAYRVEAAIPFKILDCEFPSTGTEWGTNAFRMCTPDEFELDGWNLPVERLSNPAGYGKLVFE